MELGLGLTQYVPLVFYVLSIVCLLLTLFYKIEVGIYFVLFLLPQENVQRLLLNFPFGKDIFDFFAAALLLKWFINKSSAGEPILEKAPHNWPVFLIIIWSFACLWYGSYHLGIPYPVNPGDWRLQGWKEWLITLLLFFVVVNNIKSPKQIALLIWVFTAAVFLVAYVTFSKSAAIRSASYFSYSARATGSFMTLNANGLGSFLAQNSLFLTALVLTHKKIWQRMASAGTASLSFFSMLFTFSRSGYLATLVGFCFLGLRKNRLILIPMMLFLLSWNYILPTSVVIRVNMTFNEEGGLEESAATRFSLWEQAQNYILQNPAIGQGFMTIPMLHIHSTYGLAGGMANSTHSGYILLLTEFGIIGFTLFLWHFALGIRLGLKIFKRTSDTFYKGLGLGFVLLVLAIMVNNIAHDYWYFRAFMGPYWILLGVVNRVWINIQNSDPAEAPTTKNGKPQLRHISLMQKVFDSKSKPEEKKAVQLTQEPADNVRNMRHRS